MPAKWMIHRAIGFGLLVSLSACLIPGITSPVKYYRKQYRHQLDASNTFISAGKNYTLEQMPGGHYIRKEYHYDTGVKTREDVYADSALTIRNGPANTWSDTGIKWRETNYRNGKKDGAWKHYYPLDGRLIDSWHYTNDTLNGLYITRDTTRSGGVLDSGLYKNGQKEGLWVMRWTGSSERTETSYKSDLYDGPYRIFSNDSLVSDHLIKNGRNLTAGGEKVYEMFRWEPSYTFPGGEKRLNAWLAAELNPAQLAQSTGISGTANFMLYFKRDGTIIRAVTINGLCHEIETACRAAISRMPRWHPPEATWPDKKISLAIPVMAQ